MNTARSKQMAIRALAGLVGLGGLAIPPAVGQVVQFRPAAPTIDRWNYPFDSAPGFSESAATFSALGQEDAFPPFSFDQRDGQVLLGWDTNGSIPAGLGTCRYRVLSASVVIAVTGDIPFRYDPTYDARTTYLAGGNDVDLGRPIEMYGVGFRNGWNSGGVGEAGAGGACPPPGGSGVGFPCYYEGDVNLPGPPFGPGIQKDVRTAYPTDGKSGGTRDISNNIRDGFDPTRFSVGQIAGVPAGSYVTDIRDVSFGIDVSHPDVQLYLRRALDKGRLMLMVSSLQPAASVGGPGSGEYARFFMKEHPLGNIGGVTRWARLALDVRVVTQPADLNSDGAVNTLDLTMFLGQFGNAGPLWSADLNCDGFVNTLDLTVFLGRFGQGG